MRRPIATLTGVLLVCWPQLAGAQTASLASPSDFAKAASACIDAVSPIGLDSSKLVARGWVKQSEERAPFGQAAVYTQASSVVRIYASPTPSGYCIVDGYAKDLSQFDLYQGAITERLKIDYGTSGLTDVTVGKAGVDDRRQGFVIANAVAGYSGAMRPGGLNLRFNAMNVKFAGSAQMFQTSRPPLSEAEMAENRAKDSAAADFAKEPGTARDLVAMVRDCATALRGEGALPGDGWRKSIHASGSPRAMEALKTHDMKAVMEGMAQTRQVLFRVGRHGLVTKYYVRGVTNVCEATIYVDPLAIEAIKTEATASLALGKDNDPSGKAKNFAGEYMIADLGRTFRWEQSEVGFHKGYGTSLDGPASGKTSISIFVF